MQRIFRYLKKQLLFTLVTVMLITVAGEVMTVHASSISAIKDQIAKDQQNLEDINNTIYDLTDEQDLVEEIIADLNSEIINMMTSISLKEEEIVIKEGEIAEKQVHIEQAQQDYEAAKKREEEQYAAMKSAVRFMYETNSVSFLAMILNGSGISDIINKAEYIERVYKYGNDLLTSYEAVKNEVHDLWDQLVRDKQVLEADKVRLENDRAHLQNLKTELDSKLEQKKRESANYEAEIKRYKQEAAAATKKIQQEQKELERLQQLQKAQQEAANGNYKNTGYTSIIDNAAGSDLGKKIAKYGCQYIGNPYVWGGTSLTEGADCSGFVWRIYKNFGYSLPRTSYEQRSAGTGVAYENAQPGDLICYDGHVGMYIGDGLIVHASNKKSGIKVNKATYRTILAVRRII